MDVIKFKLHVVKLVKDSDLVMTLTDFSQHGKIMQKLSLT